MSIAQMPNVSLSRSAEDVLENAKSVTFFSHVEELVAAAVPEGQTDPQGYYTVGYDVDGEFVEELKVCRVKNGVAANYTTPYMRRRDAQCMVIADDRATDKPTFKARFDKDFEETRQETFAWLKTQDLACFFFNAGRTGKGLPALVICPANAGFFGLGLAMLQGIIPIEEIEKQGDDYHHTAIIYIAPPFRHTHFDGKQVVVHNRRREAGLHELFSYNLYPGPSAKKGVYGMLLTMGEKEDWTTAHCSTVQVVTPYDNTVTFMHEGASGGGKSEMLEHIHREADGRLRLGTNTVTGESPLRRPSSGLPAATPSPTTWPCATPTSRSTAPSCPAARSSRSPTPRPLGSSGSTTSRGYGTDPHLEKHHHTSPSAGDLLFLNIDAKPESAPR